MNIYSTLHVSAIALLLVAAQCEVKKPEPLPPAPAPVPTQDIEPVPTVVEPAGPTPCQQVCTRLRVTCPEEYAATLGEDLKPGTADDGSCVQVCENVSLSPMGYPADCVLRSVDCKSAARCFE